MTRKRHLVSYTVTKSSILSPSPSPQSFPGQQDSGGGGDVAVSHALLLPQEEGGGGEVNWERRQTVIWGLDHGQHMAAQMHKAYDWSRPADRDWTARKFREYQILIINNRNNILFLSWGIGRESVHRMLGINLTLWIS